MPKHTKATPPGMHNDDKQLVELYIPRKCSATNQLIHATDHAAAQISVGDIDASGNYTSTFKTYCFSGFLREKGGSDQALNRLCLRDRILREC
ncbi:40S ribosomal protein S21 [Diplonema papillatum]|nr:40S ribosomal protein S21 [Diplonema papillatum]KAJ9447454.1 40S ribosomal protein S21 [Diplonema papillatum]|eukprot:gene19441-29958_t